MITRIEVAPKTGSRDARGLRLARQVGELGLFGAGAVAVSDLYFIEGNLSQPELHRLVTELLVDDILEEARISSESLELLPAPPHSVPFPTGGGTKAQSAAAQSSPLLWGEGQGEGLIHGHAIEVTLRPGVTDSAAESLRSSAEVIGIQNLSQIAVGQRFVLGGRLSSADAHAIAERLLINTVVQTYSLNAPITAPFVQAAPAGPAIIETIMLRELSDEALTTVSRQRRLALDLAEMRAIQLYFRKAGRDPTDAEIEMLAQTWSEHCVHKTFRAKITYTEAGAKPRIIDGLLKSYIRAATDTINKPWVRSAFVDNAGVIAFDDTYDLAFKVETHNHPSALEPFGGANTGVGGVVRDIIGVSARPIANTDVLCFGPQDMDAGKLPAGVLHPRRIFDGVTHGIEDYGNKMGIPTVNGAFCYDEGYTANPLVFCGCLGLVPIGAHPRAAKPGDLVVVIGGRTGRDGIGGATFSSMAMGVETALIAGSSVQIGHPIHEKQTLEAILIARDEKLYTAITDCGAGGLSSSIGEMAAELGAVVHLDRVPLKYAGLQPWEVWLSEAQERMVLAVPAKNWRRVKAICDGLDIEATALGEFTGDKRVRLLWDGKPVGDLSTEFLNEGIPRMELAAEWSPPSAHRAIPHPVPPPMGEGTLAALPSVHSSPLPLGEGQGEGLISAADLTADLLALLARPGTRSNEDVVRHYDHEVQGGSVVKPFVGVGGKGPSDAAVICPQDVWRARQGTGIPIPGVALSVGIHPALGKIDPYAMAWAAVDEAVRNCVAVGADPDRIAILDNFCWGNPRLPDRLGSLVRCCQGCHDAAVAYGTPFVSGKDSLNNEFLGADGKKHAIPGTLLISAMGIVPDVSKTVTSDFKAAGNTIFVLGITGDEMAASTYFQSKGRHGGKVPKHRPHALNAYRALHIAIKRGLVVACHDCSEGGIAVALAEMAIGGGLGAEVSLGAMPADNRKLTASELAFSESLHRLIVEVAPSNADVFDMALGGNKHARIGKVIAPPELRLTASNGDVVIETSLAAIEHAFRGHLMEAA